MDDARIQSLTAEVLADLRAPVGFPSVRRRGLDARSAGGGPGGRGAEPGLAGATARYRRWRSPAFAPSPRSTIHPSLQLLGPSGGGDACVLEPDKPCVGSGQCRTFGH